MSRRAGMMEDLLAARPSTATFRLPSTIGYWRIAALAVSLIFALIWTVYGGKDVHWDAVNYHLYAGFSAMHDRFALDFFAAGPPSYLNPYAFIPLYVMNAAGWSALSLACALALWHGLALWLTFEIAWTAGSGTPAVRGGFATFAALFAAMNPVLLQGLGSTLSDLSTTVFVLGAWLCIARVLRFEPTRPALVAAGLLSGIAAALKLSNAVFAIAAIVTLFFVTGSPTARVRTVATFALACAAAFMAVSLPWAWTLWREFGNPFFPLLNHAFLSPEFTQEPLRYERFMPDGIGALLWRPFAMLSSASHVHTEPRAPDLRYAALLLAIIVLVIGAVLTNAQTSSRRQADDGSKRALIGLLVGFAAAWLAWLLLSGNSRYFVPMACVAAVLIALMLQRIHRHARDSALLAAFLIVLAQGVQLVIGSDLRRDGGDWEGPWLRVEVPERLRREPALYLSGGFLSASAFLPYLHKDAGMVNIGGFNVIGPGSPGWHRTERLIDRSGERLRLLLPLPDGVTNRATLPGLPEDLGVYVRRLGLRIDGSDCEFLRLEGNLRGERRPSGTTGWKHFISCRLLRDPGERVAYERAVSAANTVFDRVEDVCPNLFHPRRPLTTEYRFLARTYHMGSELQLYVDSGRVKYYWMHGGDPVDIGSIEDWLQRPTRFDCSVKSAPGFGGLLQ